jgi:hypothetical protein
VSYVQNATNWADTDSRHSALIRTWHVRTMNKVRTIPWHTYLTYSALIGTWCMRPFKHSVQMHAYFGPGSFKSAYIAL